MGRHPQPDLEGPEVRNPDLPMEALEDGCPGGWYRTRFMMSLDPFLRLRTRDGGRVQNHLLDRCEDDLIVLFANYFESEQNRAIDRIETKILDGN